MGNSSDSNLHDTVRMLYYLWPMPTAPRKSEMTETRPKFARSLGFGLMLAAWWIFAIEIPGRNLFIVAAQRGIERVLTPLTIWAFSFTQSVMAYRIWAVVLIVAAVVLHRWLWVRRERWDIFGKWVFKTAFLLIYIFLYGLFLVIFVGAELPIWRWPSHL